MRIRKSKNISGKTKNFICPICGRIETFPDYGYNKLRKGMKPDIASAANLYNYILPVCETYHDKLMIGGDNDIFELAKTLYNAGIYASDIFEGQLSEEESDTGNGKELFFISPYIVLHAIKNSFMTHEKIDSIVRGILNDNSLFDARTYMVNPGFEDHGQSDRIDNRKIFIVYKGSFPDSERAQRREFNKCRKEFSELVLNLTNAIKSEAGHGYMLMDPVSNILN